MTFTSKNIDDVGGCRRRRARSWILALVGLPLSVAGIGMLGFRINLTPSEPLGLWRIVSLDRPAIVGDLVLICPPETLSMKQARARGYLRSGLCPGGYAPLIKSIAAIEGARVVIGGFVTIDGRPLPHSDVRTTDGEGRPISMSAGGTLPAGEVFVHSPFIASFDSRYFGPIPASGILGRAEEVLTYAP